MLLKTLNKNYFSDIVVQRLMLSGDLNWFGENDYYTHGRSLDDKIGSSIVKNYCKDYEDKDDNDGQ